MPSEESLLVIGRGSNVMLHTCLAHHNCHMHFDASHAVDADVQVAEGTRSRMHQPVLAFHNRLILKTALLPM